MCTSDMWVSVKVLDDSGVAQQVLVPSGIEAVKELDLVIHGVLFIVFADSRVVFKMKGVCGVLLSHVRGVITVCFRSSSVKTILK